MTAIQTRTPTSSTIRFPVEPRLVPAAKAARYLHLTLTDFNQLLPALHAAGFPKPCPVTGHYDLLAIGAWQDRRSGLAKGPASSPADVDALVRERLKGLG